MKKHIILILTLCFSCGLAQAQYPELPIDSIQFVNQARLNSLEFGVPGKDNTEPDYVYPTFNNSTYEDTVTIEGVVIFEPSSYGLSSSQSREAAWLATPNGGAWSGVQVMYDSSQVPVNQNVVLFKQNMKKGRTVKVTGVIRHFQQETQLTVINVPTQVISLGPTTIDPEVVDVDQLMFNNAGTQTPQFATGEQWEGVYVELKNVTVVNPGSPTNQPRYQWSVQDANGNRIPIRDVSGYFRNDGFDDDPNTPRSFDPPANGSFLPFIRGVITESGNGSFKSYYIAPLYPDDVATPVQPPAINGVYRSPAWATSSDAVDIRAEITDLGAVTAAELYYTVGYGSNNYQQVTMSNIGGDWYEATVPAQADGSIVQYYIKAVDDDGYAAYSPDSLGNNSGYKVLDEISDISAIQQTPYQNGASMFAYDTLTGMTLEGVVVSTSNSYDLGVVSIQSSSSAWGAISIRYSTGDGIIDWKRGDRVRINKAVVTERIPDGSNPFGRYDETGVTYLENIGADGWEFVSRCNALPASVMVPFDSLMSQTFDKEPYENMIVEVNDVWVVQKNADSIIGANFGEFAVHTDVNAQFGFRADDYSNDLFTNRVSDSLNQNGELDFLPVFKGMLVNTYGNWKFLPRNRTDMSKSANLIPPYQTLIGNDTLFVIRGTAINDPWAEACDDLQGDISADIVTDSSNVDIEIPGTYEMSYTVSDNEGNNAEELYRTVVVSPGTGIRKEEMFTLKLYPVPAHDHLNLAIQSKEAGSVSLRIMDLSGRVIMAKELQLDGTSQHFSIAVHGLISGTYLCQINSEFGTRTEKITVLH